MDIFKLDWNENPSNEKYCLEISGLLLPYEAEDQLFIYSREVLEPQINKLNASNKPIFGFEPGFAGQEPNSSLRDVAFNISGLTVKEDGVYGTIHFYRMPKGLMLAGALLLIQKDKNKKVIVTPLGHGSYTVIQNEKCRVNQDYMFVRFMIDAEPLNWKDDDITC